MEKEPDALSELVTEALSSPSVPVCPLLKLLKLASIAASALLNLACCISANRAADAAASFAADKAAASALPCSVISSSSEPRCFIRVASRPACVTILSHSSSLRFSSS